MLIDSISSIAPVASALDRNQVTQPSSVSSATPSITPAVTQSLSSSAVTPAPDVSLPAAPDLHAAQAQNAAAGASDLVDTLVIGCSATVAGTNYAGSIMQSGEEYTASVASLLGADASGSSIPTAETNLDIRIDELV